jgi:ribosomal protein S18 acetylase RimI-like enzyme
MSIEVAKVTKATPELTRALNVLIPQLSSSASPLSEADVAELVANEAVTLLIAKDGETVVGTLTLVTFPIPTGLRAWIEDVVVDEDARGLGVGVALTTAAIDLAKSMGVKSIDLTSRPSREAANAMYVKTGFVKRETNVYRYSLEN